MIAWLVDWWARNASVFLIAATLLTLGACLAMRVCSAPIQRRRLAEAVLLCIWVGMAMSCVPLVGLLDPAVASEVGEWRVILGSAQTQVLERDAAMPSPSLTWAGGRAVVGVVLLGGAVVFGAYLALGAYCLHRLVATASPAPDAVTSLVSSELPRGVRILVTERSVRAFCCGLWRPTVVLPRGLCAETSRDALRPVLLHELAHLEQRDLWGQALLSLSAPLLWWNPAYWWIRRQAELAVELIADDIAATQIDKPSYVRGLITLADGSEGVVRVRSAALAVVDRPSEFFERMERLMQRKQRLAARTTRLQSLTRGAAAIVVTAAVSCLWAPATAQESKAPKKTTTTQKVTLELPFRGEKELAKAMTALAKAGVSIHTLALGPAKQGKPRSASFGIAKTQLGIARRAVPSLQRVAKTARAGRIGAKDPRSKARPGAARPAAVGPRVRFNFQNADVHKVIGAVAKITGANVVIPPGLKGKVTIRVKDVAAFDVLDMAAKQFGYRATKMGKIWTFEKINAKAGKAGAKQAAKPGSNGVKNPAVRGVKPAGVSGTKPGGARGAKPGAKPDAKPGAAR